LVWLPMSFMSFWRNLFGGRRGETITNDDSRSGTQDTPEERQDEAGTAPPPSTPAKAEDELDTPRPEDQSHDRTEEKPDRFARDIVFDPPPSPPQKSVAEESITGVGPRDQDPRQVPRARSNSDLQ
jgi:hypothetical protein